MPSPRRVPCSRQRWWLILAIIFATLVWTAPLEALAAESSDPPSALAAPPSRRHLRKRQAGQDLLAQLAVDMDPTGAAAREPAPPASLAPAAAPNGSSAQVFAMPPPAQFPPTGPRIAAAVTNFTAGTLLWDMMSRIASETIAFDVTNTTNTRVRGLALVDGVVSDPGPNGIVNASPPGPNVLSLGVMLPLNITSFLRRREYWLILYGVQFGVQLALKAGNLPGTTVRLLAPNTYNEANGSGRSAAVAQFLLKQSVSGVIGDGTAQKSLIPASLFALNRIPMCSPYASSPSIDAPKPVPAFYRPIRHLDIDVAALLELCRSMKWRRIGLIYDESKDDLLYITRSILRNTLSSTGGAAVGNGTHAAIPTGKSGDPIAAPDAAGRNLTARPLLELTFQMGPPATWSKAERAALCQRIRDTKSMVIVSVLQTFDSTYLVATLDHCDLLTPDRVLMSMTPPLITKSLPVPAGMHQVLHAAGSPPITTAAPPPLETSAAKSGDTTGNKTQARFQLNTVVKNPDANVLFLSSISSPFRNMTYAMASAMSQLKFPYAEFLAPDDDISAVNPIKYMELDEAIGCGYSMTVGLHRYAQRTGVKLPAQLTGAALANISLADFNQSAPGFIIDPKTGDLIPPHILIEVAAFAAPRSGKLFRPLYVLTDRGPGGGMDLRPWTPLPGVVSATPNNVTGAAAAVAAAHAAANVQAARSLVPAEPWEPPLARGDRLTDTPPVAYTNPMWGTPMATVMLVVAVAVATMSLIKAVALLALQSHTTIRASTPLAGVVICLGSVLMAASAVLFIGIPTRLTCHAQIWTASLGHSLAYSALLSKTYRIHKVFHAQTINAKVTLRTVSKWTATIVAAELVLLAAFSWLVDPRPQRVPVEIAVEWHTCASTGVAAGTVKGILLVWNVGLSVVAALLAIKTRNVYHQYNESQLLAITIYNEVLALIVVAAFTFSPGFAPRITPLYQGALLYLAISKITILLGPLFLRTWRHARARHQRDKAVAVASLGRRGGVSEPAGTRARPTSSPPSLPRTLVSLFVAQRDSGAIDASVSQQLERFAAAAADSDGLKQRRSAARTSSASEPTDEDVVWAPVPTRVVFRYGWRSWPLMRAVFGFGRQWRHTTVVFARSDASLRVHWGKRVLCANHGTAEAVNMRSDPRPAAEVAKAEAEAREQLDRVEAARLKLVSCAWWKRVGAKVCEAVAAARAAASPLNETVADGEDMVRIESPEWTAFMALQNEKEVRDFIRFFE
ncbi:hypothetical protein H9P43_008163 [Blastocladiella emersonii ATCC 22665]|nr:hypothetical protein H9P43_008163 [Blastocladiella emersonii ATCC 22665]